MTIPSRMMVWRGLGLSAVLLAGLTAASPAAERSCIGAIPCYESPGFTLRVVDKDTGQPLADVHALAEWISYGMWGQRAPVMAQDAASGPDGILVFRPWGPIRGYDPGLMPQFDPVITLFRPGYIMPEPSGGGARLLYNRPLPGVDRRTRVRRFANDGGTIAMELFRGSGKEWVKHLQEAMAPGTGGGAVTPEDRALFGAAHRNRYLRVKIELERLPHEPRAQALLKALQRNLDEE